MKHIAIVVGLLSTYSVWAEGPSLGKATAVVVTGKSSEPKEASACQSFTLTAAQAEAFINNALVVTFREIHDHYDVLPCLVSGKALFHGYPATWEIRAGGTGSISLMSGETFSIVDEKQRYEQE